MTKHSHSPWRGREGTVVAIAAIAALLTLLTLLSLPLLPRSSSDTPAPHCQPDPPA